MRGLTGMLVQALLITAITVGALWLYVRATRPAPGVSPRERIPHRGPHGG